MPQISDILDYGLRGEKARLIPTVADSHKERRAVSPNVQRTKAVGVSSKPFLSRIMLNCYAVLHNRVAIVRLISLALSRAQTM